MAKTIKTGILHRSEKLDRSAIDVEKRTVELSFSSESPVKRYFGFEILDHASTSVDLSRLNSGGALLVDHDTRDQVGVIESARIDSDLKGRATVRFGKSERAQEIFQDVVDGIRSLVSVGYRINKLVTEKVEEGVETLRATSWQPMEISLVSIPADTTVGIGRKEDETFVTEIEEMKRNLLLDPAPAITAPAGGGGDNTNARNEGANAERTRSKEINAMAQRLETKIPKIRELANEALENGMTVETFRARAMEMLPEAQPIQRPALSEVKEKDWRKYSLGRAVSMMVSGKAEGFEKEVSDELALKTGNRAQGLWIPDEAMTRNHVAGTNTLGGFLVQTENLGSEFIPLLRNRARVIGMGARVLNLSAPVTIPRQSGAGTVNWLGETVASTLSSMNFTQLTLSPQACGAFQQYSKQLLMESNPSIDALVRDDIVQTIALAIDRAALHGGAGGSGASVGLAGTTGINTIALAASGLALGNATAYPAMVSLETVIASSNADVDSMGYLMRAGHRGALKVTQRFASTDTPVWEAGNMVNGYRAQVTQQIATNLTTGTATTICSCIFFGDWNQLIIANFGATDLVVDPYTAAPNGVVKIIARRWIDVGVRTPESFAILGGILTT